MKRIIQTPLAALLLFIVSLQQAEADPWLAPGNLALRHDIQLLADAGVIRTPVSTWPMSWPDIARDVMEAEPTSELAPQVEAAYAHVHAAARRARRIGFAGWEAELAAAKDTTALRTFSNTPREERALSVRVGGLGSRWAVNVDATLVSAPDDGQELRLDGSYVGFTMHNFMIAAGAMERWWGPGWEGSLILSTNARPIPALSIERNYTDPFKWKLLRWLGPWRASILMGQMEGSDVAVPETRFFGARVAFKPRSWLELGLSRTAQWCGESRPCDAETFGKLLVGRDNRDSSLDSSIEPGNQMAGYDLRVASPWRRLPAAFYTQLIGEDEAGALPSKFLGLLGVEAWGGSRWGSHRLHLEYADTSCNFSRERPQFGCAYQNPLYPQGYRYRGRVIGHALDADGRMYSLGVLLVRERESWSVLVRKAELNRDSVRPARNTLKNVELQYNRAFAWGELELGMGFDDFNRPLLDDSGELRGFIQWRQGL